MKTRRAPSKLHPVEIFILAASAIGFAYLLFNAGGCSTEQWREIQRDAQATHDVATGATTTQPTTRQAEAKKFVEVVKLVYPPLAPLLAGVGALAGGVAGIAGLFAGKRKGAIVAAGAQQKTAQAHSVIDELVDDIAAFKNEDEPWSADTAALLTDLGHVAAVLTSPKEA